MNCADVCLDELEQKSDIRRLKQDGAPSEEVAAAVSNMKSVQKEFDELKAKITGPKFDKDAFDEVMKRRMIVVPSFEIHGGVSGLYDFGPVGAALKENIISVWKKHFVLHERMLQVEGTCLTSEAVLKTSGHVDRFVDFMTKDESTGFCYRADKLLEDHIENLLENNPAMSQEEKDELERIYRQADAYSADQLDELINKRFKIMAPDTGKPLSRPFPFNLMFETTIGPEGNSRGFLRPETAQGIFVNFKRLLEYNNKQTPFAAAQIGLGFRNEITPKNGLIRVREFCMAEIEHFVHPDEKDHPRFKDVADIVLTLFPADNQLTTGKLVRMSIREAVEKGTVNNQTLGYFMVRTHLYMEKIGINMNKLRFRQHLKTEMAHYACDCWDAEIKLNIGWVECVGHADRACYDLKVHAEDTKNDLRASRPLTEPKEIDVVDIVPDRKVMGKTLKRDSGLVLNNVESLPVEEAVAIGNRLAAGENIDIEVESGRSVTVTPEMLKISPKKATVWEEKFYCSVIEPSFGIGRIVHSVMEHSFDLRGEKEIKERGVAERNFFKFRPLVAPVKCAVLNLLKKPEQEEMVTRIAEDLIATGLFSDTDTTGASIGRKYSRMDEIGVPFAITVDVQSTEDGSVTLRERDSQGQVRLESAQKVIDCVSALCNDRNPMSWEQLVEQCGGVINADQISA